MTSHPLHRGLLLALCIAALATTGCAWKHVVKRTDAGGPKYDKVQIVYEIRDGHGALGSQGLQPVRHVAGSDGAPRLVAEHLWGAATLGIDYPHPDARAGYARCTLRLSPDADVRTASAEVAVDEADDAATDASFADRVQGLIPWSDGDADNDEEGEVNAPDPTPKASTADGTGTAEQSADEIWILDVPRSDIDLLLVALARRGFFDGQVRPVGGARIDVSIDRGHETKLWDPDPRLDDLAERVYTRGWISGFAAPRTEEASTWWSLR